MLANVATKNVLDRWKGILIAAGSIGLLLLMGMSVYRNVDLGLYTSMPAAMRSLVGIGEDTDVGGLAYGAIYASYGALTLAALSLSMGSASIAGEERNGTLGLLLGNPKSRTSILVSKATSMVGLTAVGALVLLAFGLLSPALLSVELGDMHIWALVFSMFVISIFHGFLAMAIGAWTGKNGLASGVTAGIMTISFIGVGLFPLIDALKEWSRIFPWYYYSHSEPALNGVDWGGIAVLIAAIVVLAATAVVGVNRRDLRGQTTGVSLIDRLRTHPITKKVADRLAGSARVSHIWIKTLTEHQGLIIIVAYIEFFIMGILIGPMYTFIDEFLLDFADALPEAMLALFGGGDLSTAEGFYQVETFGMMAPIAVMVVTIAIGARALAGEEANRTMGILLANPIKRSKIVYEKTVSMIVGGVVVGFATFAGVALGSVIGGLGMSMGNIAATCLLLTLLGLVFGGLALAFSAATGKPRLAIFGSVGIAIVLFVINAFLPFSDNLAGLAKATPFYYYLTSDPLLTGMHWGHGAILAGLFVVLIGASVVLFQRRDLRQTG
ncbi:MAG: ABC transporter permease subunit [Acidimicrobiia bacterium]|nr:ABC transporter permease subunit [Acidimicrobiia bacterium]